MGHLGDLKQEYRDLPPADRLLASEQLESPFVDVMMKRTESGRRRPEVLRESGP